VSALVLPRFFATALESWQAPAPRWVLVLGDATTDYRDVLDDRVLLPGDCTDLDDSCGFNEPAWAQHVPTRVMDLPADDEFLGYYASDTVLTLAVGSDWWPDITLGRLPVRDRAGLDALLAKAQAYEAQVASPPAWAGRVLQVSDEIRTVPEEIFEDSLNDAAAAYVQAPYERTTFFLQSDYGGTDTTGLTADLLAAWEDPAQAGAVVAYTGHGSAFRWGRTDLLTNAQVIGCRDDVPDLSAPGTPEPLVVNANCITGAFMHHVGPSILEELVRAPDGGAIAAIGPTGLTYLGDVDPVVDTYHESVFGPEACGVRAGDVLAAVQARFVPDAALGAPGELLSNVLLGDPVVSLVVPHGPRGGDLRATGGDARVDVEWDVVAGADAYDLYRAEGGGELALLAPGLATTSYEDLDVVNGVEYRYVVLPRAGGWPGCWSAEAVVRPCAPSAIEPPSALAALPPSCGTCIVLTWSSSPSPDVRDYVLGIHPFGDPTLPPERTMVIPHPGGFQVACGLVPFREYAFTLRARSWCGSESDLAPPAYQRITCPLAADRPAFVTTLHVRRQGTDLRLDWDPITTTVQGAPLTPDGYVVHGADQADFPADLPHELAVVPTPGHVVPSRVGDGVRLEVFTVAAVAPGGARGASGHDFPQGVRDLVREDLGGTWRLTWTPVRDDIRGELTPVAAYRVHASTAPLTRADVEGRPPDLVVTEPTADVPAGLGDYHYVTVVDVHGNESLE